MDVRVASLTDGAMRAAGTAVIIDVFRAFTTAAIALSRGASRIIMVDSLERALELRASGIGDLCIGERGGMKPTEFDFGNSPAQLADAQIAGMTLIQTTTNGTAGVNAARNAERIYAGSFVTAEATVQAILRDDPAVVTLVAMGREGRSRADEDELCALYLRSRLEGRMPDVRALRMLLSTMAPLPNPKLLASADLDPRDREIALSFDIVPFSVLVRSDAGLLIATADAGV